MYSKCVLLSEKCINSTHLSCVDTGMGQSKAAWMFLVWAAVEVCKEMLLLVNAL